ncbi:hypothetical protein QBC37DRAFT_435534 [Rhypophila decipiens]|uniref:Uncharacterized protein n=1 Tax=Rhypophila decipiens TaxID=261697 RepID=A0AAN6XSY4_9PEZI|nr:hypothetical protein QBC37DRAFT_435534 [Rhypophila decipiens]
MSLATLRAHVWKGGNDVVLHYKDNRRKEIPFPPKAEPVEGGCENVSNTRVGLEAAEKQEPVDL